MTYIKNISELIIPIVFSLFLLAAITKKADAYEAFSKGAKESLGTVCDIFPAVFSLMTAIAMLRASGLMDFLTGLISPLFAFLKIPPEILPTALLRPLSGSGSIALLSDTLKSHNPDSLIGIMASVITASTETTFYTIAVYFGAVGISKTSSAVKPALIADFVSILVSIILCRILF